MALDLHPHDRTNSLDPMRLLALFAGRGAAHHEALGGIAPTRRATIATDGNSRLQRFSGRTDEMHGDAPPVLLVPSLINRWYVLDLCSGASVVEALVGAGLDVWCVDWGIAEDEDRHLAWDDVIARLLRFSRLVLRRTNNASISMLGYCMGATLTAIGATLLGSRVGRMVNLAGPIDFSESGTLGLFVDSRWFHADAIADAGNIAATQMQNGFIALDPGSPSRRWRAARSKLLGGPREESGGEQPGALSRWAALDHWAADNISFPAAAYRTYIGSLYQRNELALGQHVALGERIDLGALTCPILTVVAERDAICPPRAALALNFLAGSKDVRELRIAGGHVGAVVGGKAAASLYPALIDFFGAERASEA